MEKILPIVVICVAGIAVCLALLGTWAWKCMRKRFHYKMKNEVFEMDEKTLTVKLDKKDFHK